MNPLGIQADALWSEDRGGPDFSFDTLWHSRGKLTSQGYVVWMEIPLKSLRFPSVTEQKWGFTLLRTIPRNNEWAYWPRVSSRIEGRLNQAATLAGIENVSPGRNLQLIPYGVFRSFRALDTRDSNRPRFTSKGAEPDAGLDAKFVFKDSLVLDVAVNPDFSQVESDAPQITVNQRFEVLFPEKRPFFLENADYFRTPVDLVFTRRIADPQLGVRATGKIGRNSIGALIIDDQSPGKGVPPDDALSGERAYFGIFRVSRDIFKQSSVGFILTDREFRETFNRVGGFDGRFKLNDNWVTRLQAVASSTPFADGRRRHGSALEASLNRSGRQFSYSLRYSDRSPGFAALAGFIPQVDIRSINQFVTYRLRPEKKFLIALGPALSSTQIWDHRGTRLNSEYIPLFQAELKGQTFISVGRSNHRERLRPEDFPILTANRDFSKATNFVFFNSNIFSTFGVEGQYRSGHRINYGPPSGQEPFLANHREASLTLTFRPVTSLRVDNTYIGARLLDRSNGSSIFNNHIIRSRAN
ncbi:MAG: DUF5916 domain-containing protein [Acidobacteriota bacterium]